MDGITYGLSKGDGHESISELIFSQRDDITYNLSEGEGHESISELIFSQWTTSRTA